MYNEAELVHWMRNKDHMSLLPAQIDIDLTNICNQDCFYCNSADFRASEPVQKKYHEYIEVLDKIATWRSHTPRSYGTTHTITYPGGGEPTVLPGYQHVIEHTIDLGFLTSITTNGSKLHKLLDVDVRKLRKLAWIGIDIDAGTEDVYERIRRSKKKGLFGQMRDNARELINMGVNVDFKILLNHYNDNPQAIGDIFAFVKSLGGRKVYIRPAILFNKAYEIKDRVHSWCRELSVKYDQPYDINNNKIIPRNYKKCHQMFHFPVMCANGKMYTCCDHKGNADFEICRWDQEDFRDYWMGDRHHDIYNKIDVSKCHPCRPNPTNIKIQNIINKPETIEELYR